MGNPRAKIVIPFLILLMQAHFFLSARLAENHDGGAESLQFFCFWADGVEAVQCDIVKKYVILLGRELAGVDGTCVRSWLRDSRELRLRV